MRRSVQILAVALLVFVAGCGAQPSYSLRPIVDLTQEDNSIHVGGTVSLEGQYGDELRVKGVIVEIRLNNTTIDRFDVGTLDQGRPRANFSSTVPSRPDEIRLYYNEITPQGYSGTTFYLEWRPEDDVYSEEVAEDPEIDTEFSETESVNTS